MFKEVICLKKAYEKPQFLVEKFALTQQIAKCDAVRISSTDMTCVFKDPDATYEMKQLAAAGMFMDDGCPLPPTIQSGDGLCYFSNVHLVFAST